MVTLVFRQLPAQAAKALGCDAKERSDLMIGNALPDLRIFFEKFIVSFTGGFAERGTYPLHRRNECVLQQNSEVRIHLGNFFE